MSIIDFTPVLPAVVVGIFSLIVLLGIAIHRNHRLTFLLSLSGEVLAFAAIPLSLRAAPRQVTALITADRYSLFFAGLILAGSIAVTLIAYNYMERHSDENEEFYVLLLLAAFGSLVLASSSHFISFFVGLEILSVSLYTMIAYPGARQQSLEAGLKYLILAGASGAFLVFGMALVYAETGTMEFSRIPAVAKEPTLLLLAGFALIVSGIGFKLALVPFHMWTPDVYQGAPAPVAAFIATISKGAVFALLLRYFVQAEAYRHRSLFLLLTGISIASMVAGNFLALLQNNLKRILAYSSIAHLGYLLVAFLASRDLAIPASSYYLTAYFISILSAFGVITVLSPADRDMEMLEEYQGLFWRRPWPALVLSASLFSLAGIPLTAGFVGKFYLLAAGVGSAQWLLVIVLVSTSAIGLFYYLRVIVFMYATPSTALGEAQAVSWSGNFVLVWLMVLLLWFGVYPSPIMRLIQSAVL